MDDGYIYKEGCLLFIKEIDKKRIIGSWQQIQDKSFRHQHNHHFMPYGFLAEYFHEGPEYKLPSELPATPEQELEDLIF